MLMPQPTATATCPAIVPAATAPGRSRRSAPRRIPRWLALAAAVMVGSAATAPLAWGQTAQAAPAAAPPASAASTTSPVITRSALDGVLFYQLLISELELRQGDAGTAYKVMLEAAKRSKDETVFRRAVDIALNARAGEQVLEALKVWRQTLPKSRQAVELQSQMLMALGRYKEAREPLNSFIEMTPDAGRSAAIASLPRLILGGEKAAEAAQTLDDVLKPWRASANANDKALRLSALCATSGSWLSAGDRTRSLNFLREAQALDPSYLTNALLGLELMKDTPAAEAVVTAYLNHADTQGSQANASVRASYVRRLTTAQRYQEALAQVNTLTKSQPDMPTGWLMQGALLLELGQPQPAKQALERYLSVRQAKTSADAATPSAHPVLSPEGGTGLASDSDDDSPSPQAATRELRLILDQSDKQELSQAYLMLSQAAEQLKDYAGAQSWLEKLATQQDSASVLQRRATLLMRQGKLREARALLQGMPQAKPEDKRTRYLAEAQLLRDAREWKQAYELLEQANRQLPDDPDMLYEQALLGEKLNRFEDMETLLRRVIKLKPDQQHAYNALGYSLADRNVRLNEARQLIQQALSLTPGDPFITDSLGWVEFRLGRKDEALSLLDQAYKQRPDVEIAAHLGEVLWSLNRRDEALKVWREALGRDKLNEVLNETLSRLKVKP